MTGCQVMISVFMRPTSFSRCPRNRIHQGSGAAGVAPVILFVADTDRASLRGPGLLQETDPPHRHGDHRDDTLLRANCLRGFGATAGSSHRRAASVSEE